MTTVITQEQGYAGLAIKMPRIVTTSTLAQVVTAGWYNNYQVASGQPAVNPQDLMVICHDYGTSSQATDTFDVSIGANGIVTLSLAESNVVLPTIANHIATYTNTSGGLSEDAATAINGGNIQAGLSGTAGTLASFPSAASKGSLKVVAVANTGDTVTTISNAAMGQASVVSIPDPAAATANFVVAPSALVSGNVVKASGTAGLVVDAGFALHSGTTAAYAGGGTSNAFTTTNMTAASIVTAVILTSTNDVSITKAVPGTNTLTVTFSADPGANTTVNWISVTAVA